ncbi:IclR family transcriptional regulator [Pseudolysinimonas sp.]|uniref:IclR family transcriptional regulator n=1 Tax=Pseudolysinimonas sp. TaxID=2680009 RepID=UPI003F80D95F
MAAEYAVPALDKAFDVLELVAASPRPLAQNEIAERTGRTVGQLFRVLVALEARGWLVRDEESGRYTLSMAAFDLAHRQPALRGLLVAATPAMRALADELRQSCNLGVLDMAAVRVVGQAESPADFGYRVRVGALFPLESAAGAVLVALGDPDVRAEHLARLDRREVAAIERDGLLRRADPVQPGITDVAVAVRDRLGAARAVLTVPYVATSHSERDLDAVVAAALVAADRISKRIIGVGAIG